jgi:hypothetical protein
VGDRAVRSEVQEGDAERRTRLVNVRQVFSYGL